MSRQGGKSPSAGAKKRRTEDKDEDLPRGGGGGISALEMKKIHKQADSDFLFEMKSNKGNKKQKGKGSGITKKRKHDQPEFDAGGEDDLGGLASSVTSLNVPKSVKPLKFEDVAPGLCVLGAVDKVKDFKIHVSLPNNLSGIVPITEVSDTLSDVLASKMDKENDDDEEDAPIRMSNFFKVGQLVPCVVKSVDEGKNQKKKKTIVLSTRPSLLYQNITLENITAGMPIYGSVKSVEDHGYIMTFGQAEYSGFLVKNNTEMTDADDSYKTSNESFTVGQLVPCIVESVKRDTKTIRLCYDFDRFCNALIKDQNVLTIQTLKAGMLVSAQVKKVYSNGLFLTFLGYFGATVDRRHIPVKGSISGAYAVDKKVTGRIITVDCETRTVRISLLPHIVGNRPYEFPDDVQVGKTFETAKIVTVHTRSGIVVDLPTQPIQKAFIYTKMVSDEPIDKLGAKYTAGEEVVCRVLSLNQFEGIANAAMKKSILELPFLRIQDIPIGQKLKGTIVSVLSRGLVISLSGYIKAFCPMLQMSDIVLRDPSAHFTVGSKIKCKVLSVDASANKVIVTCKKTMVSSDLPVITSYENAKLGMQSHGVISSVKEYGVFVTFFNGVTGLVGRDQLSNSFIARPEEVYSVGQVVKCRVLTCDAVQKRISLSFLKKVNEKAAEREAYLWQEIKPGSIVTGKVQYLIDGAVRVQLDGGIAGVIPNSHLSDHPSHCEPIRSALTRDKVIKEMLVWTKNEAQRKLTLSCKPYLIEAAKSGQLVLSKEDLKPGMIVPGTIRGIESYGCFVELVNGISGLAYVTNLVDGSVDDPKKRFTIGQTVRAAVIDNTGDKLNLTLKSSQCGPNTSTSFLKSYFAEEEAIAHSHPEGAPPKPKVNWATFEIGASVEATVKVVKDFGAVLTFDSPNVTGFAVKDQLPAEDEDVTLEEGTRVKAVVLDIDKQRCIVDVSLRSALVNNALPAGSKQAKKKKRSKRKSEQDGSMNADAELPKVGDDIEGTVELIKGSYLVVSIPSESGVQIGYVATKDFNTINSDPFSEFIILQKCKAIVKELPSGSNARLIMVLSKLDKPVETKKNVTDAISELKPGMIVKAKITSVLPTQLNVSLGAHVKGRVHITEIADDISQIRDPSANPLMQYKIGETIQAKVLQVTERAKHRLLPISHQNPVTSRSVDLTLRPSSTSLPADKPAVARDFETLRVGQKLLGIVERATPDGIWLMITCMLKGRAFILDMAEDAKSLQGYTEKYQPGMAITCYVKKLDREKNVIDLSLIPNKKDDIQVDTVVLGRVSKVLPHVGVNMQLSSHTYGRAFITDIFDDFTEDPLSELKEGDLRDCYVLGKGKGGKIDLSLRPSRVNNLRVPKEQLEFPEIENIDELTVGKKVRGYVQEIRPFGLIVALSRSINASISKNQLGNTPVNNVAEAFPVGKLIEARVKQIQKTEHGGTRVSLTMRSSQNAKKVKKLLEFSDLKEGLKVQGTILGVRQRTLLIRVTNSKSLNGMCHISEVSDDNLEDLTKFYKLGDRVRALVVKVDKEKQRFFLSLKPSHFEGDAELEDTPAKPKGISESKRDQTESKDKSKVLLFSRDDDDDDGDDNYNEEEEEEEGEEEEEDEQDEMQVEGLAPVGFDWGEASTTDDSTKKRKRESQQTDDETKENEENMDIEEKKSKKKRAKRAQKLAEEDELRAKEDEILAEALPKTADDYEKLLLASPNSSFLWIKYMAFQLSIAEIDKAREIAERALKRINYREEQEKLNVWVALMNLENKHGTNESLMQVFQRALTYNDPKAVHLQLVGIYERSEQYKLAEELYKAMVKKFKHSWQIWLRFSQFHLKCMHSIDGARKALERALQVLPKKKHITVISKMAQMEFKHGSPERGRTIFEGIVSNYPKRVDIWGIYIDMELKLGDHSAIRNLFEKVTTLNLSSKKMRYFFERYLKFEREYGTKETVAHVREKARQYVLSKAQD